MSAEQDLGKALNQDPARVAELMFTIGGLSTILPPEMASVMMRNLIENSHDGNINFEGVDDTVIRLGEAFARFAEYVRSQTLGGNTPQ